MIAFKLFHSTELKVQCKLNAHYKYQITLSKNLLKNWNLSVTTFSFFELEFSKFLLLHSMWMSTEFKVRLKNWKRAILSLGTVAAIFLLTMIQQSHTHTSTMSSTHQLALSVWDESPYTLSHEGKRCQRIHTQQILFPLYRMSPNSSYATKHQLAGEKQEIFFPLIIDHLRLLSWSTKVVNINTF